MSKTKSSAPTTIHVLMTGGTIGADPYPDPKNPPINATFNTVGTDGGNIRRAIENIQAPELNNSNCDFIYKPICNEDSKVVSTSDQHLTAIVTYINEQTNPNSRFLITCGTDAMVEIGKELSQRIKDKRVIITGAMMPLSNGQESDGHNNLKDSLKELSKEKGRVGVGICFDGDRFNPNAYVKNFELQKFIPKHGKANWTDMVPQLNQQRSKHELPAYPTTQPLGDGTFKGTSFVERVHTINNCISI